MTQAQLEKVFEEAYPQYLGVQELMHRTNVGNSTFFHNLSKVSRTVEIEIIEGPRKGKPNPKKYYRMKKLEE